MKNQESITDVIAKNFNYALHAIPRALGTEKPKRKTALVHRKPADKRKTQSVKTKAKRAVGRGVKKAKKAVKTAKRSTAAREPKAKKMMKAAKKRSSNVYKLPKRSRAHVTHARAA